MENSAKEAIEDLGLDYSKFIQQQSGFVGEKQFFQGTVEDKVIELIYHPNLSSWEAYIIESFEESNMDEVMKVKLFLDEKSELELTNLVLKIFDDDVKQKGTNAVAEELGCEDDLSLEDYVNSLTKSELTELLLDTFHDDIIQMGSEEMILEFKSY